MIKCEDAAKLFYEYMDRELSEEDIQHLKEHLDMCKDCLGHVSFDEALRGVLKNRTFKEKLSSEIKSLIQDKLKE